MTTRSGGAFVAVLISLLIAAALVIVLMTVLSSDDDGGLARTDAAELVYFRVSPNLVCSHDSCPVTVEWLVRENGDSPTVSVSIRRGSDANNAATVISTALEDKIIITPSSEILDPDGRPIIRAGEDEFVVIQIDVTGEQIGQVNRAESVRWLGDQIASQSYTGTDTLTNEEIEAGEFGQTFFLVENEMANYPFLTDRTSSTGISVCGKHIRLEELTVAVPRLENAGQSQRYDLVIETLDGEVLVEANDQDTAFVFVPENLLVIGSGVTARITVLRADGDDWTGESMRWGFFVDYACFGFD